MANTGSVMSRKSDEGVPPSLVFLRHSALFRESSDSDGTVSLWGPYSVVE